jgi:osmotically inducible protein OsmC
MIRKARAVWRGSGRAGNGDLSSDSGVLANTPKDNDGFHISRSVLTLRASVPNLDQDTFDRLAQDAEHTCLVSRVLRAEITLDARLV